MRSFKTLNTYKHSDDVIFYINTEAEIKDKVRAVNVTLLLYAFNILPVTRKKCCVLCKLKPFFFFFYTVVRNTLFVEGGTPLPQRQPMLT